MKAWIVLLRAVNVGGTGKLPMAELRALCGSAGFARMRTYIASGNVVLSSASTARQVQETLQEALARHTGRQVGVLVRSAAELRQVLADNPFPKAAPNRVVAIFLGGAPPSDALESVTGRKSERLALGKREIYVHYGDGMADSKLKIPAAKNGTARNINTITRLLEIADG
ncbi:DUF1697 domain-containing protein [Luteimonas suaedae]|uniref:DUF1697 domain-containing protein n=1 Tax=Luteimonas suaedae TaxID=2605430 RepID=UPI0011EDA25F|nr:DUF1697 domain-containing protein [Luteimonas suaedae]